MTRAGWIRVSVVAAALATVQALCWAGVIANFTMIPPSQMVTALVGILASGRMTAAILRTFRNVGIAILSSVLVGFVLGAVFHALPRARRTVEPLLASYYYYSGTFSLDKPHGRV